MNKMTNKNYDMAQFHMVLTECLTRMDVESSDSYNSLDKLFTYLENSTLFQLELIITQLGYMDPLIEPEMYNKLISLYDGMLVCGNQVQTAKECNEKSQDELYEQAYTSR